MTTHNCGNCGFRGKYDKNPNSFFGKVWRWHAGWCPGWKKHITSLPDKDRIKLAEKYGMEKYKK